jgi:DNA invertase Pin-like site-specific DNA recombinase
MLIGYMRVSKSDGTQTLDLQRDALLAVGVAPERLYEDLASGRKDARPGYCQLNAKNCTSVQ